MFDVQNGKSIRRIAAGLAILSLITLTVTAWILANVRREQEIVARLMEHLPKSDLQVAKELSGDLNLQSGLSFLLVLNIIATAIAFAMVVRGYLSSERSLQDAKVLSADILASMDAGVITTDKLGALTSINPSGRELIGIRDDGIGRNLSEIGVEHSLLHEICKDVSENHRTIRDRDYCVVKDGHKKTLRAGCTLLRNRQKDEMGTVIHVRDVTQKALMEERLLRMERYMGLGSLAAGLHHEIKNPLSALSLHIQLLSERLAPSSDDAEVTETLEILQTEVHRINKVLDGFHNYASVAKFIRQPVDLTLLVEKLVRLIRPQAESHRVKIDVEFPDETLPLVKADPVKLEQVLLNLAINAMDAMQGGGRLCFRVHEQTDSISIEVIDSGRGIPEEIQAQVFDPYFTTRSDGTGMGLAICDKIIRQHDGSIDFRTSPRGTTFTVLLPMEIAT